MRSLLCRPEVFVAESNRWSETKLPLALRKHFIKFLGDQGYAASTVRVYSATGQRVLAFAIQTVNAGTPWDEAAVFGVTRALAGWSVNGKTYKPWSGEPSTLSGGYKLLVQFGKLYDLTFPPLELVPAGGFRRAKAGPSEEVRPWTPPHEEASGGMRGRGGPPQPPTGRIQPHTAPQRAQDKPSAAALLAIQDLLSADVTLADLPELRWLPLDPAVRAKLPPFYDQMPYWFHVPGNPNTHFAMAAHTYAALSAWAGSECVATKGPLVPLPGTASPAPVRTLRRWLGTAAPETEAEAAGATHEVAPVVMDEPAEQAEPEGAEEPDPHVGSSSMMSMLGKRGPTR